MKSYYALTARIPYYGTVHTKVWVEKDASGAEHVYVSPETQPANVANWKEPPHVALANLRVDEETGLLDRRAVERFTRTYGVLPEFGPDEPLANVLLAAWPEARPIDLVNLRGLQELLRRAWRREPDEHDRILMEPLPPPTQLAATQNGIEIRAGDLWTLIRVLFLRDSAEGRARVCANPDCNTLRYFLQARKGQVFCSHPCAVLINVRRFREAQRSKSKSKVKGKPRRRTKR